MAYQAYPLTPEYDIPKSTLVFPSINAACMQVRRLPAAARCLLGTLGVAGVGVQR